MTFVSRSSSMPREKELSEERATPTPEGIERSASERPATPLTLQQPKAPQFVIPLPPQLLVACDARLVLATEVTCEPPANFSWLINGKSIPKSTPNASQMHWTEGSNQSSLVIEPPVKCANYACLAQNANGEARSQTHLVDENSEEAAQIHGKHVGSTEVTPRLLENITTIVKTDVERELIEGDSDSDDSAADTVSYFILVFIICFVRFESILQSKTKLQLLDRFAKAFRNKLLSSQLEISHKSLFLFSFHHHSLFN
jgi:hypothetical protein